MTQYLLSVHMVDGEPEPPADVIEQMYKDVDVSTTRSRTKERGSSPAGCTQLTLRPSYGSRAARP